MGPNNSLQTFIQSTNKHCCCDGQYCKSSNDMGSEKRFSTMTDDFDRFNKNIFDTFTSNFPTIEYFDSNLNFPPLRFGKNWDLGSTILENPSNSEQIKINNEDDRLEILFDTTGFEKEDLKINRKGHVITVEGSHTEKSSDDSNYVSKRFSRSYTLPSHCIMEKMKSSLSNNKLSVSVPKNLVENETLTIRQVPIEHGDKNKVSNTNNASTLNKVQEHEMTNGTLLDDNSKACSNQVRNVPISVEKHHTSIPKETTQPPNQEAKIHGIEPKLKFTQEVPSWFRPILLFNKDESIFNTNMQSKFYDNWKNLIHDQQKEKHAIREVEVNQNDPKELKLTFDLNDYKPNELKVTVLDNVLKVEAKHEETSDGNHVSRHFVRSYVLPDEYKIHEVQSSLSKSGKLAVTIPKKNLADATNSRNITIKME